jgi:hypothetical protein
MASTWKDPFSNPPPLNTTIWLRRTLVQTHLFTATLPVAAADSFKCGPSAWPIPDIWVWSWREPTPGSPPPANPPISPSGYRDVMYYPPPDQQQCWVRRWPEDTAVVLCTWHAASLTFVANTGTLVIPWYAAVAWKPPTNGTT